MMQLKDYLNAINTSKQNLLSDPDAVKDYVPYIVNRCLSYFPDTLFQVNEINQKSSVSKEMHFGYLLNIVRKSKRFSKWLKQDEQHANDLKVVKEYYGFSNKKAEETLSILSESQLSELKERNDKGGKSSS